MTEYIIPLQAWIYVYYGKLSVNVEDFILF
jgi:hypothetical protein